MAEAISDADLSGLQGLVSELRAREDADFAAGKLTPAGFPLDAAWLDLEAGVASYVRMVAAVQIAARPGQDANPWLVIARFGTGVWVPAACEGEWVAPGPRVPNSDEFIAAGGANAPADAFGGPAPEPTAVGYALAAQASAESLTAPGGPGKAFGKVLAAALEVVGEAPPAGSSPAPRRTLFAAETAVAGPLDFWVAIWPRGSVEMMSAAFADNAPAAVELATELRALDADLPEAAAAISPSGDVFVWRAPPARRWELVGDAAAIAAGLN